MEANNRAWALAAEPRTPDQDKEMLSAAEAALFHWSKVGTELNIFRAKSLVAEAHALVGHGDTALVYAKAVSAYFEEVDAPDWEAAYIDTILAHAAKVAGDDRLYDETYPIAQALVEAIADPEDKAIVMKTFEQI